MHRALVSRLIRRVRPLAVLAAVSLAAVASAQQPPDRGNEEVLMQVRMQEARDYYQSAAPLIAASGQPRDLALAAIVLDLARFNEVSPPADGTAPAPSISSDPQAVQWRELASARAGSDVLANAMLLATSTNDPAAQAEAARRWRTVEPDNLAPRLYDRTPEQQNAFPDISGIKRNDLHYYDQVRWISQRLLSAPPSDAVLAGMTGGDALTAEEWATSLAASLWAGIGMPQYASIDRGCSTQVGALEAAHLRDCRQLADVLRNQSDTVLSQFLGMSIADRLADGSAERQAIESQRLRAQWRTEQWGRLSAEQPKDGIPQFVRLLKDPGIKTEQQLVTRILDEANVSQDPPAGWQPTPPPTQE